MVSVIIAWKARPELKRTLEANAPFFARHSAELIIVNCGGDTQHLESLMGDQGIRAVRLLHVPSVAFNRSLANNLGAAHASHDFLFFLDADVILKSDVLGLVDTLDSKSFIMIRKVHESEQTAVDPMLSFLKERINTHEFVLNDGRRAFTHDVRGSDGSRCGPGLVLVRTGSFLEVGGFNSTLSGWGFEDVDLQLRLQFAGMVPTLTGEVLHLSHPRNSATAGQSNVKNTLRCFENYRRSNFAGTFQADVDAWRARTIERSVGVVEHLSAGAGSSVG